MAGGQNGPLGSVTALDVDGGTLATTASPPPASATPNFDRSAFESAMQALEAEIMNAGGHSAFEAERRRLYQRQIRAMADDLQRQASSGAVSWAEAAAKAREVRETIMMSRRDTGTAVGRAFAQRLKDEGPTLNSLVGRNVQKLYGASAEFHRLTGPQQDAVYGEIVRSAGKSNPRVNATMRSLGRAGRGMIVVSVGLSVYEVATADDKLAAAGREAAVTGAGIGGGVAGGALAGLACGPGAPVCVTVGAFVGGALAAFGVDLFW